MIEKLNSSLFKVNNLPSKRYIIVFFVAILIIVTADQWTKGWIRSNLAIGQSTFDLGWFRLTHIQNTGGAFGILPDQSLLLIVVGFIEIVILIVAGIFVYPRFPFLNNLFGYISLGFIFGGAVGNLTDRLRFNGSVTDFLYLSFWPSFNIADSAIVCGSIIVVILLVLAQTGKLPINRRDDNKI
jgi:signal peptidase II